jgi:pyruvate formate lyase activating enzyme
MVEASYYISLDNKRVKCVLCPRECVIAPQKTGFCKAKENRDGKLYAILYGKIAALHLDPMEKKPLYHFYPGSNILSIGTLGCNLRCRFCQNWQMVDGLLPLDDLNPDELIRIAKRNNSVGIAYTYNEPLMWFEYIMDSAKIAKENGLKNVLVTNGLINKDPLNELLPLIDAMNIDLKSIRNNFYKDYCSGMLEPIKENIKTASSRCHVEITNLIIPGANDSDEDLNELIDFVSALGRDTPLHFSRYFPNYKLNFPPTPPKTLLKAYEMAKKRLNYVYLGNIYTEKGSNTYCPECNNLLIRRVGYDISVLGLNVNNCARCGKRIEITL